ncbi:hypothetical protein N9N67_03420 [Bacteriovoracaceae bacterium]|nr:hypothetical protein [Bacteriovoracaceae bacterium]
MMILIKKFSNLLLSLFFLLGGTAFTKDIAVVSHMEGQAFLFQNGSSYTLKPGVVIKDFSQVMVEVDGVVILKDRYKNTHYISGGTHVSFTKNYVEIINGKIWVKAEKNDHRYKVQSINSFVNFDRGEFIYTFDNESGKSQVVVLDEEVEFSSLLEPDLSQIVPMGKFSLIDPKTTDGVPRRSLRIGYKSFENVIRSFPGVKPNSSTIVKYIKNKIDDTKRSNGGRQIASLPKNSNIIIYRKDDKLVRPSTDKSSQLMNYYSKQVIKKPKAKKRRVRKKKAPAKHNYISLSEVMSGKKTEEKKAKKVVVKKETNKVIQEINSEFENSLNQEINKQTRHPASTNSLINELKSIKQNYRKEY